MKAKTVNEEMGFQRDGDIKTSLNVGKISIAKKLLDDKFNNLRAHESKTYTIHSLDNIEINYSDEIINSYPNEKAAQHDGVLPIPGISSNIWKYVEIDAYHKTKRDVIEHMEIDFRDIGYPYDLINTFKTYVYATSNKGYIEAPKHRDEPQDGYDKKVQTILDALNKNTPKIRGFVPANIEIPYT